MALREILTVENPVLRKISRPVVNFNERLWTLIDDMTETMRHHEGVGLAAPQVGILRQVIIIDVEEGLIEIVNPTIVYQKGEQEVEEGCLSVPGKRGITTRPNKVKVTGFDRNGKEITIEGEELLALALVHEVDHLFGKLYIDIVKGDLIEVDK